MELTGRTPMLPPGADHARRSLILASNRIASSTLSTTATRGLFSPNSANVRVVLAATVNSSGPKVAVPSHTTSRVTPRIVKSPTTTTFAVPAVGTGCGMPRTSLGTKTALGYRWVCRMFAHTYWSRRDSPLAKDAKFTTICDPPTTAPERAKDTCPVTAVVTPMASMGMEMPASCSRIKYRPKLSPGTTSYNVPSPTDEITTPAAGVSAAGAGEGSAGTAFQRAK